MKTFLLIATTIFFLGCGYVVSKELRENVDKELIPMALFEDPDAHKGKTVMLGGTIASSVNAEEGTYIEVVEKPLDYRGRPKDTDVSAGRLLILYEGYLDTAIYSMGRDITVAGEVFGKKLRQLGEIQYAYPLIIK